jgi:zinc D-Ala-D-Ala carboxypeptidase
MSILGEQFEPWVQSQIRIRQNLHGLKTRDNNQLNILNNQNAWLKLGSSVQIEPNSKGKQRIRDLGLENTAQYTGIKLASKSVLFNTMSDLDVDSSKYTQRAGVTDNKNLWNSSNAYGLGGNQFGIVPAPGLISADIKAKNRGSIREANIVIKANNKFQFELIELLYLRLGYSMLLEWGWNKYHSSSASKPYRTTEATLMETYWFQQDKAAFTEVIDQIYKKQKEYEGNYDGFLGKVVNFDWKFNPDGTYDITLKLITVGDVIESLKVNLPQTTATVGQLNQNINQNATPVAAGLKSANSTIITNAGDSTLSYSLYSDIVGDQDKFDGSQGGTKTGFLSLLGVVGDEIGNAVATNPNVGSQETPIPLTPTSNQGSNTMKYSFFLTLKELLNKVEQFCLPSINGDKILGIDLSDDQICAVYPYQFSMDPRVCFIKPFFLNKFSFNSAEEFTAGTTGINNYSSWLNRVNNFGKQDKDAIYGNIMNIYLNYDFVTSVLANETNNKGDIFLFKFLQKICDGINDAMGGINNIECILTKDRQITFIEQNPIPGIETSEKYGGRFSSEPTPFELYGYNPSGSIDSKTKELKPTSNFVRDFGFNTKIDPQLASMITIGATAEGKKTKNYDGTAFSKWNDGLKDRFSYDFDNPAEPSLVEIAPSAELGGMTLEQFDNIKNTFVNAIEDTSVGPDLITSNLSWFDRDQKKTTFGTVELIGTKDIKTCPVTGKSYKNLTWSEYGQKVRSWVINEANKNAKKLETKEDVVNYIAYCVRAFGGKENSVVISSPSYFKFDNGFITLGKNSFKGWVNTISNKIYEDTGEPSNTVGFIPIDLNLKCDGISGVKIYNQLAIRQEFLPRQYPRALKFLISQVNHKISANDWITDLNTISTANTKNTKLTAEAFKIVEYDLTDKELIYTAATFGQAGVLTIIPGVGGIPGSGIAANQDPGKIINPTGIGSRSYINSPLAKWFISKGLTNGINEQILPQLVDTGESGNKRTRLHNNGTTTWYLAAAPAAAWVRWKADALASGYRISLTNGYRSQQYQASFGNSKSAAKPGSSPHGWGGAVDIGIHEKASGKLRHQMNTRYDFGKRSLDYGDPLAGNTGEGALSDRLTEDWKVVAILGARYGFYNPARLQNKTGKNILDEAWHFEYWGPVEVGYVNPDAVAGGVAPTAGAGSNNFGWGGLAPQASPQANNDSESWTNANNLRWDVIKIFKLTDNYGPNNQPLFKPAKSGGGDDEDLAKQLFISWLDRSFNTRRFQKIKNPDFDAVFKFLERVLDEMDDTFSDNVGLTLTVGKPPKEQSTRYVNTNF